MVEEFTSQVDPVIVRLFVAAALGMFLGLERERSKKSAGVRTFTLTSLLGGIAVAVGSDILLAVGGLLVVVQAVLLGSRGLFDRGPNGRGDGADSQDDADDESDARRDDDSTADSAARLDDLGVSLSLTTSTSLLVAYAVGAAVVSGFVIEGVVVALTSSLLLVLRRELHGFARRLTTDEVRSAVEFAIIAFVVYPLLPEGQVGPWDAVSPRTVWLLVVAVSAIGFVNYVIIRRYGERGIAITGFFGGLVNSTAVIGEIAGRTNRNPSIRPLAAGAILMADAAMALRNLSLVAVFVPELAVEVGVPLGLIALVGVGYALHTREWGVDLDVAFESPFSLESALRFGVFFLLVLLASAAAQEYFGATGFVVTSFLGGLVSSGSVVTTAVTLYDGGTIGGTTAVVGVLAGTAASIAVKVALAASVDRELLGPVARRSALLVVAGVVGVIIVTTVGFQP
ncbi:MULTISPECIES: MgtC/SapB family protein [unclassified Haloferax]|uniref:MgtC/SapB family protein n=1 Tax=unclassified Haloferax TaxID=2625095 RepID=UPI0002AFD022|nr:MULTISPECIES: MgtC/SapB family protein [unclassified Haloferax]ELZ54783.1 magnesium transporter accessory protein [Haloferax sp. ATCC BAA-646]ELZ65895.1 magnesium transporter accessory protein [Haloferax sp. ATCC BAA-644]ELZ66234.1 magnesium transporter accessory protein [Haloferax sp. ATCC BAA-645]